MTPGKYKYNHGSWIGLVNQHDGNFQKVFELTSVSDTQIRNIRAGESLFVYAKILRLVKRKLKNAGYEDHKVD